MFSLEFALGWAQLAIQSRSQSERESKWTVNVPLALP